MGCGWDCIGCDTCTKGACANLVGDGIYLLDPGVYCFNLCCSTNLRCSSDTSLLADACMAASVINTLPCYPDTDFIGLYAFFTIIFWGCTCTCCCTCTCDDCCDCKGWDW